MLNPLTSFRFLAALLVFIHHVEIGSAFQLGYVGVSFFFILSGFILTYTYSVKMRSFNNIEMKKFYSSRIAKIYPVHVFTFFLAIPYYFFIPLKHDTALYIIQAATNLLLIHSFIPFGNVSFNGVSWSLSDELFFYAMFPILVFIALKYFKKIKTKVVVLCVVWLTLVISFSLLPDKGSFVLWFAYFFPVTRLFEFMAGVLLGFIFLQSRTIVKRISPFLFSVFELCSVGLLVAVVIIAPAMSQNIRYGILFIPIWSILIYVFSFQRGAISTLLSNRILVYLGKVSFSFYMIHNLVLSYIFFLWKPNINTYLLILICFSVTILLSVLMYHFYEEPMRIKVKKLLDNLIMRRSRNMEQDRKGRLSESFK
ncbi:acyltransferase family protein [Paenibacillus mendelii]|uniref:Acyltransferase family protein n=1 Tax=Paenibacillus mendelii TaxID=206163 RepID=A0ABV6JML9_9BACL|nr:acyltransferase [Paenibacillus mendelii]MCQ6558985.1 acyltransferase [Paenibacillus mendelii]